MLSYLDPLLLSHRYFCMYIYTYTSVYICLCIYTHLHLYIHICVCMCFTYTHIYKCIHAYLYIYVYRHFSILSILTYTIHICKYRNVYLSMQFIQLSQNEQIHAITMQTRNRILQEYYHIIPLMSFYSCCSLEVNNYPDFE